MPPHLRVIKLRHSPRHPTQVEAHAVLHRRQIKFFGHGVYMHFWREIVKLFFQKSFQRSRPGQKHLKSMPSRKARCCPSRELTGLSIFPFQGVPPVIARRKAGFPSEDLREMAWTKTYLTA